MKRKAWLSGFFLAALCFFILLFFFSGSGHSSVKSSVPRLIGNKDDYTKAVLTAYTDYRLYPIRQGRTENIFSMITDDDLAVCLDIQIDPQTFSEHDIYFTPHTLKTVVFAVDHDLTSLTPTSWDELMHSGLKVNYPTSGRENLILRRAILGSLSYALDGPDYDKESALLYLETLKKQGRLRTNVSSPVTLCFDCDAVEMLREGKNIEIVIPKEGTLSFACGLVGSKTSPKISDDVFLKAGCRLLDGRCENELYPPASAYAFASRVVDVRRFINATKLTTSDLRREVLHTHHFNSADGRENIIMITLTMLFILFWSVTAFHRINQQNIRVAIRLITILTISWLLLCMFKYMLPSLTLLSRILWFSFYIFLMGLPLTALYMSVIVDLPSHKEKLPKWFLPFVAAYPCLLVLVFTNDFHHLVFQYDLFGNWSFDYSYGYGYYFILVYSILCFLLSLAILIFKSRKSPGRYAWAFPALVATILIAYNIGYILGVPLCIESNLTFIFCIFSILFTESLLNSGLIPVNIGYRKIFSSSPLNMQLLDHRGNVILSANNAGELTDQERCLLFTTRELPVDENTLLHSCKIHGGLAVWQEDLTKINELQSRLEASIENIEKANGLLKKEEEIRRKKIKSEVNEQLFCSLEKVMEEQTFELSHIISNLSEGELRQKQIAYIPMLLCYIKRRSNLFFLTVEGRTCTSNELAVYIDELSEFASYSGLRALVRCGVEGALNVSSITLCYDFYFSLLRRAVQQSDTAMIGTIEKKGDEFTFRVMSSATGEDPIYSKSFRTLSKALHATLTTKKTEEHESLVLTFLEKGGFRH